MSRMSDNEQLNTELPNGDREPSIHDEETSELVTISDDAAGSASAAYTTPDTAHGNETSFEDGDSLAPIRVIDAHEAGTVPMDDEELLPFDDPKKTLPGSGGFDPNPDFTPGTYAPPPPRQPAPTNPHDANYTVPHIVPFEHTMVHVPGTTQTDQPKAPQPPARDKKAAQFQQSYRQAPNTPVQAGGQATIPNMPAASYGAPNNPNQQYTQPSQPPGNIPPPPGYTMQGQVPPNVLPPSARKPRRVLGCTPGCLAVFLGLIVTFCGGSTLVALILASTLGAQLETRLNEQLAPIDDYQNFQSTFFYDRNGELLYEEFTEGRRTNVDYEAFPQDLINATIAIEDDTFFTNPGFEVQATARAFLQYVGLEEGASGGSTITQQLVRNVLFDYAYRSERSIQRKVEEILLAYLLNQRMSKQDVMALYLNEIFYGNRAYGAAAAARTLFDKRVQDLTLAEAALLAGLPQAPSEYDPFSVDPEVQAEIAVRWRLVLDRMVSERMITSDQRNAALSEGYTLVVPDAPFRAPHFTVYAQDELQTLLIDLGYSPDEVARGGLRVYTTIDLRLQNLAEQAARTQINGLGGFTITNGAVIVTQPITGEIMAMVGSLDYENDAIDGRVNVTISPRQPGSTMKPLTYAAALERGETLGDIIWDTETVIGDYTPVNYDRTFHGPVRIRTALANSYNIPAVQTLRRVGVDGLLELSSRFGIETLGSDASRYGLSLTLGGGELTLLELTRAYSVFGNGGNYVPTTAILCIIDNDNNIRYQYENGCTTGDITAQTINETGFGTRVLDPRIAYMITDILADNAARSSAMGSNSPLYTGGIYTAVKTGTTDDFRDNWTVGYNRNLAVGVWVGNSDGTPMSAGTTGLTGAAPIWNAVVNGIYSTGLIDEFSVEGGRLPDQLDAPTGISSRRICAINALREPALDCTSSINELFMDNPAGVPDGQGGLSYPAAAQAPSDQPPPTGVWLREVEPSIYRVHVHAIPPQIGAALIVNNPQGGASFPAPIYCQLPVEAIPLDPTAREQLFIAPPIDSGDAARAEQYARANGFAFLPTIACNADLINATGGSNVITAFISQPTAGQVVFADMPILGTASFTPQQALFYKLELSGGQFGDGNWVTMGTTHNNPVVNGQLEILPGLSPGNYMLQLAVVGNDGNYVQQPFQVPFSVQ